MRRHVLVALLVSVFLLVAVFPLLNFLFNRSAAVDFSQEQLPIYVKQSDDKRGELGPKYVSGEVILKFKMEAAEKEIVALGVEQGVEEVYVSPYTSVRRWRVPPSRTVEDWADFFGRHPLVEYAEPNYFRYAFTYPNDPYYVHQWHFDDDHTINPGGASSNPFGGLNGGGIGMEDAWSVTNGSSNIVVAVVDTGIAYEDYAIPSSERGTVKEGVKDYQKAPDLAAASFWVNVGEIAGNGVDDDGNGFVDDLNGWDFINGDAHPNDNNGHGTHVAGTIAQATGNGLGVAGIASETTLMPVKVLDYSGGGYDITVADGIYYAVDNGAKIVNLSLGGSDPSETLEEAVAYAYGNGVVVIAASGNAGSGSVDYPAAYDGYVIAVGATRYDETKAPYSNFGTSLDLVAPGGDLDVDQNEDGYADGVLQQTFSPFIDRDFPLKDVLADPTDWGYWFFQGTSMATPHVSGVAALLLARDSTLSPDEIKGVLESTAEDLGEADWDSLYGWGLLDAEAALRSIAEPVHLMLNVEPVQTTYARGQSLTLTVTVFNEFNPALDSTLTLTVIGPAGYYKYDFEAVSIEVDAVEEYRFYWDVPEVAGTYVVEVNLVPPQLTAYDAMWLKVA